MLKISNRPRFTDEMILIDGITRAGKFLISHVVSAHEGIEFFQYVSILENLLYLCRHKQVSTETVKAILHSEFDIQIFNMIVGRYLNTRIHDLSCIYKSASAEEFLTRATTEDREWLIQKFIEQKRLPLFICHEGLANADILFSIFPQMKMVQILRDPASLVTSWFNRGWGRRIGHDPRSSWITFDGPKGPIPWWAVGWRDDYHDLSEMDRCVLSICQLYEMCQTQYLALPPSKQKQIHFIKFESLIANKGRVLPQLSQFLQRKPLDSMSSILARERIPRTVSRDSHDESLRLIRSQASSEVVQLLEKQIDIYNSFWEERSES